MLAVEQTVHEYVTPHVRLQEVALVSELPPGVIATGVWWDTAVKARLATRDEPVGAPFRYLLCMYWTITTMMGVGYALAPSFV